VIAGRYTLDREVGRGGMGAVWLGRDEVLGREVAVKRIGMMPGGTSPDLGRAEREARLAARLNHPHVVAVFDLVQEDGQQWLVMEYVEGVTLSELVRRDGALTPDQASPLIEQAADALAAAHEAGIVHRDVKPSNILVTPQGQVKLSDFGIARAEADASLTQTGLVTGSPAYLAPEIASGASASDASDVWSLGATLYHALAGRPPYDVTDNLMGALYRIVHEEPPRLANAGWLAPLLDATMTREPADRWTMAQVRDFLRTGPRGTVVHPAPDRTATRPMASAPTPTPPAPVPPVDPTPAGGARGGRRRPGVATWLVGAAVLLLAGIIAWAALSDGSGGNDPADDAAARRSPAASSPSTPRSSDSPSASPSGSPSPSSSPSKKPSSSAPADRPTAAGMEGFIADYLGTVTQDPDTAFTMLTPAFQRQSGGIGSYKGFWGTIERADLQSVSADPQDLTVTYDVEYTRTDGSTVPGNVSLDLAYRNGRYLIAGES
jgi:eukaryotic-like serine/threonine-protein kinase